MSRRISTSIWQTAEIALDAIPQEMLTVELTVSFEGQVKRVVTATTVDRIVRVPIEMIMKGDLDPFRVWAPGSPNLYDLRVRLLKGSDTLESGRYLLRHAQD